MGEIVTLTLQEMIHAAQVGVMRRAHGLNGAFNKYKYNEEEPWEVEIVACQAELALAKYFNLHWSGVVPFVRDVGDILDARSIRQPHHRLLIHDDDPNDTPFVLVLRVDKSKMDFDLRGWVFARDGKLKKYEQEYQPGRPCYYVDNEVLHPITRLQPWIDSSRKLLKT